MNPLRFSAAWLLCLLSAGLVHGSGEESRFEFSGIEMAVPVRMVLYAPSEEAALAASQAALARIRELNGIMSDYDPASEVRRLSASSGSGEEFPVSADLWNVLSRANEISIASGGAFDVTIGPVVRLWRRARRQGELPTPERIQQQLASVGFQAIEMRQPGRRVLLTRPGMWIDLGGIAKGYAIDEALKVLRTHRVSSALVDAGGDIGLGDAPPDRDGWVIGVAPLDRDAEPSLFLSLSNVSVATSGDSWQFVEIGGRRYSHLVDPCTGLGLTDHSSVTVIARDATTADALASAASVLGPERGRELVDSIAGAAALIVRAANGAAEQVSSRNWGDYPRVQPSK
ncbi:MAG: FAD:protein FMN transferase [Pirellulaceae bacterium]|jgi:thiamine biosynthesis lipoprotein|nr:FAD:protein FMN transferase [Thermoguttaceae bacterium]NLZ02556.1 FAD:protein FMN transferase [Pirellulaceae bacterium]